MQIFFNEFLDKLDNKIDKLHYKAIIEKIEKFNPELKEWTNEDVDEFLYSFHSTSVNSLQKYLTFFRNIHKYYCSKKNISYQPLRPAKSVYELLDFNKLRSTIITKEDYNFLRHELDFVCDGEVRNYRDKVVLELAWETLTAVEIKNLRKDDVELINNNQEIVLHLKERDVVIHDKETISDIKNCLKEESYYRVQKNGQVIIYPYKGSKYLIRPISIRTDIKEEKANVAILFKSILKRSAFDIVGKSKNYDGSKNYDRTKYELNLENMSVESIRRSKLIYLLSRQDVNLEKVKNLLGKKQSVDLSWLNKLSKEIYG